MCTVNAAKNVVNNGGKFCSKILNCFYNAVLTCEIQLFQNYFSHRRRPAEIILFQCVKTCLKLFRNYFTGLLQLMHIFQHVHCCWNDCKI